MLTSFNITGPIAFYTLQHLTTRHSLTRPLTGGVTVVRVSKHACVLKADNLTRVVPLQINLCRHRKQNLASLVDRYCK